MAHASARWDAGSQIIITRVLAAPNHHAVLGIRPNATAAEMRTARKKLMVALHPDRNKAPGAEDAFKKVNEAYNQALPKALRAEQLRPAKPRPSPAPTRPSPAPPPAPTTPLPLDIAVPQGVNVGDKMQVTTPLGKFEFVVPPNAAAGKQMTVTLPGRAGYTPPPTGVPIMKILVTEIGGVRLHLKPSNTTGYAGVQPYNASGSFTANGPGQKHIGRFPTAVDAAVAYAHHMMKPKSAAAAAPPPPRASMQVEDVDEPEPAPAPTPTPPPQPPQPAARRTAEDLFGSDDDDDVEEEEEDAVVAEPYEGIDDDDTATVVAQEYNPTLARKEAEPRRAEMAVTDEERLTGKKRALEEAKAVEAEMAAKRARLEAEVKEAEARAAKKRKLEVTDARESAAALEAQKAAKRLKRQE